ncbi:hypothetical protein [Ornithinibacillus californiensis]|uniref:hypothetical protein n=1 Tax=Ornithinibacillus californiensis TaxID=161536 RepID=UPI00064D9330|nr:hypothetical protein [Ornithinibacillus californiensis]
MEFIEPRNINADKVDWLISERVRAIVYYYAEYTEYTESDVVDKLLLNILDDKKFIEWIKDKRNNKRIIKQVNLEHLIEEKEEDWLSSKEHSQRTMLY